MKIHVLGTAAAEGFPSPHCKCTHCEKARKLGGRNIRTRSSVIIDDTIKIDYPADTLLHAFRDQIDLTVIEHLLFTHTHYDHFCPEDLHNRIEGYAHGFEHALKIYGNDLVIHKTRQVLPAHSKRLSYHRLLPYHTIKLGEASVTPLLADHDRYETCYLYYIEKNGKHMLHGHDTGWFPEETWQWLQGKPIDLALLDCTNGQLTTSKREINHMNVETVREVKRRLQEESNLGENSVVFATHFSHNCGLLHDDLVQIFQPDGIQVAYDGMIVQL
ncbi:MBL fold metallo-hydrolase [Paenibacillus sp. J2TS4]|uniref:MBL fold metallo-hydrolase n=1 Tax=Paenibacillus sp. J2TS4 TaxID=2807194 RepID=UPI001B206419|nr:MBL fold metallo-hydrolase [Paenibacillus sp. J2TS4]GIP32309.1 hypothetical protein J2TS4_15190 [Paenibacillus sp. J2TS4]